MNLLSRSLVLLSLSLTPGCLISRTTVDQPIDRGALTSLEPGRSTAGDVVTALGAPDEVVQLGRRSAYRFDYSATKRGGILLVLIVFLNSDTRQDRVWAFFDENQVLTHLGATLQAEDAKYALPWVKVHD